MTAAAAFSFGGTLTRISYRQVVADGVPNGDGTYTFTIDLGDGRPPSVHVGPRSRMIFPVLVECDWGVFDDLDDIFDPPERVDWKREGF